MTSLFIGYRDAGAGLPRRQYVNCRISTPKLSAQREIVAGVRVAFPVAVAAQAVARPSGLPDGAQAVLLCEFWVLPQQFTLECVALLAAHRSDVQRIIGNGDVLDRFLWSAMNPRDPGIRRSVSPVGVIGPDPG